MADLKGEYSKFPKLDEPLPPLVRRQRRLEGKLVDEKGRSYVELEKECRKEIDALLRDVGLTSGEGVTCLGYDVVHRERAGQASINQDKLVEQLVRKFGCEREQVQALLVECTERGDPAKFAEVKPSKGAKVRAAAA